MAKSSFQGRTWKIPGSIPRGTMFGHYACFYARAGLITCYWSETGAKAKKKKEFDSFRLLV